MKQSNTLIAALALVTFAVAPVAAFAQTTNVTTGVTVGGSVTASANANANVTTGTGAQAKARGDQEIERRLTNLADLSTRIGQMKNLSASEISSLQATLSAQVSALTTLKATIDADTVLATLKTDIQSITKSYRIYMLVLPQGRIAAASDRALTIAGQMQTLSVKLQARITAAGSAGVDVTALQAAYSDMQTQIANSNTQVSAAVGETANLTPDNGDTTVAASNTAALKDARSKITAATADLKAARADITTIENGVKGHASASATASTSAQ